MSKQFVKYKIPDSWIWTTIGELGIVLNGGTPSTKERQFWDGAIPWITPADLSGYTDMYISRGKRSITKLGLDYSSAKLLPEGSIVFSSRAPIGYVAITKVPLATNQGFKNLIPVKSVLSEYVYYYLLSAKQVAESLSSGTTFLELSTKGFSKIPIPLPSLNEQKKIASRIEEVLVEIDYSAGCLNKCLRQLEIYKLAVLNRAYNGGYTVKPQKWKMTTIGEIAQLVSGQHILEKDYNTNKKGVPYLTGPSDFGPDHPIINKWTTNPKVIAERNSILITVKGSGVGKVNYLNTRAVISRQLMAISTEKVDPFFIYYYLILNQSKIRNMGTGSAIPGISRHVILNYTIPCCNAEQQKATIREIETRFSIIENLEEMITQSLTKANALKFSILNKAFNGKLFSEDKTDSTQLLDQLNTEKLILVTLQCRLPIFSTDQK